MSGHFIFRLFHLVMSKGGETFQASVFRRRAGAHFLARERNLQALICGASMQARTPVQPFSGAFSINYFVFFNRRACGRGHNDAEENQRANKPSKT